MLPPQPLTSLSEYLTLALAINKEDIISQKKSEALTAPQPPDTPASLTLTYRPSRQTGIIVE